MYQYFILNQELRSTLLQIQFEYLELNMTTVCIHIEYILKLKDTTENEITLLAGVLLLLHFLFRNV